MRAQNRLGGRNFSVVTGRRITAVIALAVSAAYVIYAWRELDVGRWHGPGAAIFPIAVGVIIAIASFAVLLERAQTSNDVLGTTFTLPEGDDLRRLGAVLGAFAIYFVAMDYIGNLIASALFLTTGTVRNYLSVIMRKLGARSRLEAISKAQDANWI